MAQPVEMKGQRVGGEPKSARHLAGREAVRAGLHQQPEHVEPIVLGEGGQRRDSLLFFIVQRI
jgi:hypothetical protein